MAKEMTIVDFIKDGDFYIECTNIEDRIYDVFSITGGELGLIASKVSEKDAEDIVWEEFTADEARIVYQKVEQLYRLEYIASEVNEFNYSKCMMQPTINIVMKNRIEDFLKGYADLKRSHSSLESQFADHNEMIDKGDPSNEDKQKAFKDKISNHNKIAEGLELDYRDLIYDLNQHNIPDDIKNILHQKDGFVTPSTYTFNPKQ